MRGDTTDAKTVMLEIPASLYAELEALVDEELTDPGTVIEHLVDFAHRHPIVPAEQDLAFQIIGVHRSERALIDNIPVSEDPDLYLAAEMLGVASAERHAWEIAPARYRRGQDGKAVRRSEIPGE